MTTVESVMLNGSQSPVLSSSLQSIFCWDRWSDWTEVIPRRISSFSLVLSAIAPILFPVYPKSLTNFSLAPSPSPLASAILPAEPTALPQIGTLRVRNQTYHPIRIALLPQLSDTAPVVRASTALADATNVSSDPTPLMVDEFALTRSTQTQYGAPVHWDFVPREGNEEGLVLALPDGQFWVQPGDIVTAFAQDGSRRYWGPYVIGVTAAPIWDENQGEWLLILETPFPF